MNAFTMLKRCILMVAASAILAGCATPQQRSYQPADNLVKLNVSFGVSGWNGKVIPEGQQCNRFGGNASAPPLVIHNVPPGTNAIIMEYSDNDFAKMNFGGHGKVSYKIEAGAGQAFIPQLPGHTFDLPPNFELVAAHKAPQWDTAGAYMPPCSGGKGNLYYVTVKAVHNASDGGVSQLLGERRLDLGKY